MLTADDGPVFSFEFFPPKSDEGVENLIKTVDELGDLEPAFVSVTYGAGGTTRARTLDLVSRIRREFSLEPMAHFTCVGASRDDLHAVLSTMEEAGVENVLALRGDPPKGETEFVPSPDGLSHANELIELIAGRYGFCVGAAAYPEVHPEAEDAEADLRRLQEKVAAGAQFLITQLFFDNGAYFAFVERAREAGITVPIVPGIMPVTNVAQIERFTRMCGATLPAPFIAALRAREDDPNAVADLGVAFATLQCQELLAGGAPGIHFYTLNRSPATRAILSALRISADMRAGVAPH